MILVDTTVWIEFLNQSQSTEAKRLAKWIIEREDLCLTEIIVTEILQGIQDEEALPEIIDTLQQFPIIRPKGLSTYLRAAELYRDSRKRGFTIRKTIDCIIAAIAEENNVYLYHRDKDFDKLAQISKIRILK